MSVKLPLFLYEYLIECRWKMKAQLATPCILRHLPYIINIPPLRSSWMELI